MSSLRESLESLKTFLKEALVLFILGLVAVGVSEAGYWVHPFIFLLSFSIVVGIPIIIIFKIVFIVLKFL